ncbi:MAG: O-antigen ligase family protein [Anaerolineae bacterium]
MNNFSLDPVTLGLVLIFLSIIATGFVLFILSRWQWYFCVVVLLFSILLGGFVINFAPKSYNLFYSDFVLAIVLVASVARHMSNRIRQNHQLLEWPSKTILWVVIWTAIYVLFSTLSSIVNSPDLLRSIAVLKQVAQEPLILIVVWTLLRGNREFIEKTVETLPILGACIAVITLYSAYVNSFGDVAQMLVWNKDYYTKNLIFSYLGRSNYLSGLLALLLPISIAVAQIQNGFRRWLTWMCVTLFIITILITNSRGALSALIATGFLLTILTPSWLTRFRLLLMSVVIVSVIYFIAQQTVYDSLQDIAHSFQGRQDLWRLGLQTLQSNPLIGTGRGAIYTMAGEDLHNNIFKAFLEAGVIGGLAYVGLIITLLVGLFPPSRRSAGDTRLLIIHQGVFFSFIVAIIHSLGEPLLENALYDIIFWSIVGIGYALPAQVASPHSAQSGSCIEVSTPTSQSDKYLSDLVQASPD